MGTSNASSEVDSQRLIDFEEDPSFLRASVGLSATQRAQRSRIAAGGFAFFLFLGGILFGCYHFLWQESASSATAAVQVEETPSLFLVETIPVLNFSLTLETGALKTYEVFEKLVNESTRTLDISVMYWNLLVSDGDDDAATSPASCLALGCDRGLRLYRAFEAAAARGVALRFLQDNTTTSLGHISEINQLAASWPDQVSVGLWDAHAWYGGGIMHMKLWIADGMHAYIGSANMDWLSLSQVKEMGVVAFNSSQSVAAVAQGLFNTFWAFAAGDGGAASVGLGSGIGVHSSSSGAVDFALARPSPWLGATALTVPCWEPALAAGDRCLNPLTTAAATSGPMPTWERPAPLATAADGSDDNDDEASTLGTFFLGAAPASVLGACQSAGSYSTSSTLSSSSASSGKSELNYRDGLESAGCDRTWDQEGLVATILDARESVSLSVMDFLPTNAYDVNTTATGGKVWWPALTDALLQAVSGSGAKVRVLVSWWQQSNPQMLRFLDALSTTSAVVADAANAGAANGSLEVGVFTVPGWETAVEPAPSVNGSSTACVATKSSPCFPPFSRVNHAKYIVTDRRLNIGTSNMEWSYFYQTAGCSFNSDTPALRASLQAAFDRDWASPYTTPLKDFPY